VYGNPAKLPVTEATPPLPINPYGEAKLFAEKVIRNYAASDPAFSATILRCARGPCPGVRGAQPPVCPAAGHGGRRAATC
jgi:UDP-glucose 4-epimerase